MDPDLIKLIQRAVRDGLTSASWIVTLVGLSAAAAGAFLGSYFKRKGEHLATREDFDELLRQIKAQTKATEEIKGEIQRDLNAFSDVLKRGREFAGFRRERIAQHLDQVLDAYIDLYAVAQLIPLRKWLYSNTDLETEARFRSSLSRLRAHFGALEGLEVISEEVSANFEDKNWKVFDSWIEVLGEAARRTPEFRTAHPNDRHFSEQTYHEHWMDLMTHVEHLGAIIKGLSHNVSLPK